VSGCATFVRTGLPDQYCGKPALFTVNRTRPVCRRHLAHEVTAASLVGPVTVERITTAGGA
jgi:hypothetical protein